MKQKIPLTGSSPTMAGPSHVIAGLTGNLLKESP